MPFQPASRITEADEKNDRHSTERRLQDSLFLVVKRNRSNHSWQFPQGKWLPEETMRKVSLSVFDSVCSSYLLLLFQIDCRESM